MSSFVAGGVAATSPLVAGGGALPEHRLRGPIGGTAHAPHGPLEAPRPGRSSGAAPLAAAAAAALVGAVAALRRPLAAKGRRRRKGGRSAGLVSLSASDVGASTVAPQVSSGAAEQQELAITPAVDFPWWWEGLWDKAAPPLGPEGSPVGLPEVLRGIKAKLEETRFGKPNDEGIPQIDTITLRGSNFFDVLRSTFDECGPIVKSSLGPAGIIAVSDPMMVKQILMGRGKYDKGPLAVISWDIFGKGLITSDDRKTWKERKQVVGQGFHSKWLRGLVAQFRRCVESSFRVLDDRARFGEVVDMESVYLNLALDVVGQSVFGVDFAAAEQPPESPQSPIVQAVYRVLKETDRRASNPAELLLTRVPDVMTAPFPQVRGFRDSLRELDDVLDRAIGEAQQSQSTMEASDLQERQGGTLLRFLVDLKGQSVESAQLKDDLRTLLIAGHETVASIMTWATFELARNPEVLETARRELQEVLGGRKPEYEDVRKLSYLRHIITETLRMYPAPPTFFRRALARDVLPKGGAKADVTIGRGSLISIQVAMLHRNPHLYDDPDRFRPERWQRPFDGDGTVVGWRGYDPDRSTGLYPNEQATDYAFVPFAGGEYKCVGDQFAMIEATIVLAMLLQRYDFTPTQTSLEEVGMDMAATIHTQKGLLMRVKARAG